MKTDNRIEDHEYWEHGFTRPRGVTKTWDGREVPTREYTEMKATDQGGGGRTTRRKNLRAKDDLEMVEIDGQTFSRWQVRTAKKWYRSIKIKDARRAAGKRAKAARKVQR